MRKKTWLAMLLGMALLCGLYILAGKIDDARVVIRVNDDTYSRAQVNQEVSNSLTYMQWMYAGSVDVTDPAVVLQVRQTVANSLVQESVLTQKAEELGLDQLTPEEQARLEEDTAATWQDYRSGIRAELKLPANATEKEIEAAIDEVCKKEGVSEDLVRQRLAFNMMEEKLRAHVVQDVTVTDEEFAAGYDAAVAEDREAYGNDPAACAQAMENGETVYCYPQGLRWVRGICIRYSSQDQALIDQIGDALEDVQTTDEEYTSALMIWGVTDIDALLAMVTVELEVPEGPTANITVKSVTNTFPADMDPELAYGVTTLAQARAVRACLEEQLDMAIANANVGAAARADEAIARLESGEDWDAVAQAYNEDPAVADAQLVYTGVAGMDAAFVSAAMALPGEGAWSEKVQGADGCYIILHAGDVPAGPADVNSVREALGAELLTNKQDAAYNAAVATWVAEADVEINLDLLGK